MKSLVTLALATLQHMTDQDFEEAFSDDGLGDYECWMEMQEQDPLDEDQCEVANAYFGSCSRLETLYLIRFQDSSEWRCRRHSDGSVKSVYSPQGDRTGWQAPRLPHHDDLGFPEVLSFPTQSLIWDDNGYPPIIDSNVGKQVSTHTMQKL